MRKIITKGILLLVAWIFIYKNLNAFAEFITNKIFDGNIESKLAKAIHFFIYETPKVLMLLVIIVFVVGIFRSYFNHETTRKVLAGKKEIYGNVIASLFGVITPFCSCSAVPLFIGFVTTGVPLGVTFSFLISAPMVNEVALVLLYGLFGWKIAITYLLTGLSIATITGIIIGKLKLEKHVQEWFYNPSAQKFNPYTTKLTFNERINYGKESVTGIVGKVWPYIIAGIAVGAGIHGYVPENFMASIMGKGNWWSVPLAVLIGVPMYSNAAGIIPIVQALLTKGAALGTVLAFMMSVIGLSLPEIIILNKVLKPTLIAVFVGVVAVGIIIVGFLFNFLF